MFFGADVYPTTQLPYPIPHGLITTCDSANAIITYKSIIFLGVAYLALCISLLSSHCSAFVKHKNAGIISTNVYLLANVDPVTPLEGPNFFRMFGIVLRIRYLVVAC